MQKSPLVKESLLTNKQNILKIKIVKQTGSGGWLQDEPIGTDLNQFVENDEEFRTKLYDEIISNWLYLTNEWIDISKEWYKENKDLKNRVAGMRQIVEKKQESKLSEILKGME